MNIRFCYLQFGHMTSKMMMIGFVQLCRFIDTTYNLSVDQNTLLRFFHYYTIIAYITSIEIMPLPLPLQLGGLPISADATAAIFALRANLESELSEGARPGGAGSVARSGLVDAWR